MPFEIFVIPGVLIGIFGFYVGLKAQSKERQTENNE